MKYELTIVVTVSESSERRALAVVERCFDRRSGVTFVDGEALTPGQPECGSCDALLPEGTASTADYALCAACEEADRESRRQEGK